MCEHNYIIFNKSYTFISMDYKIIIYLHILYHIKNI